MLERRSFKNDLCLTLCCGLAIGVVTGIVFWLERGDAPVTADEALAEANRSLVGYCQSNLISRCDFQLVDATAPRRTVSGHNNTGWQFEFYSPAAGPVMVKVLEEGESGLFSRVLPVQ